MVEAAIRVMKVVSDGGSPLCEVDGEIYCE